MKRMIHILCLLAMYACITMCMDEPLLLSLKPAGMGDLIKNIYNVPSEIAQVPSELQEMIAKEISPRFWYLKTCFGNHDSVRLVTFSPNGKQLATRSSAKRAHIFDLATTQCVHAFDQIPFNLLVNSVAFSPNGEQLAAGCPTAGTRIFDLTTGRCIHKSDYDGYINAVAFSSDGKLATGCTNGVRIFDTETWQCICTFGAYSLTFSPNGKQLATGCATRVRIFDTTTWECVQTLDHENTVTSVTFSPNGKQLATGCANKANRVRIFDTTTWQCIHAFNHDKHVKSVIFSPYGNQLITGCYDRKARIFDLTTGKCVYTFAHDDWVNSVAFALNGKQLATGSDDGTVRIFERYVSKMYHESISLQMIFMWLNVAKHSKDIKNFDLMLTDIAKTFSLTQEVESSLRTAWENFSVPLRNFIWAKSKHIIKTYGKEMSAKIKKLR